MRRVLCLWLPCLPLERLARKGDARTEGPFAIIAELKNAWRVSHANELALQAGVASGQSLPDARAICPDLLSEPADPVREEALLYALRRWADQFSPVVALHKPDALLMDVSGVSHLFGGEIKMAHHIVMALEDMALTARVGIADTQSAAVALARFGKDNLMISPAGEVKSSISLMPLDALDCPETRKQELKRTGFRTIGDLYEIRPADLARRYGIEVVNALSALTGYRPDPIVLSTLEPNYAARMSLPEPIGLISDLMEVLRRLSEQVCARLRDKVMGARIFSLTVRCVDTGDHEVQIGFAQPCDVPESIVHQFAHPLGQLKIQFGADWFRLCARQVEPIRSRQRSLDQASAETQATAQLISTLGNRLGFDRIERFVPRDAHMPDRVFYSVEAAHSEMLGGWPLCSSVRPVLMFHDLPCLDVVEPGRPPRVFLWRKNAYRTKHASGPERYTPEWWQDRDLRTRDYWSIQTEEGLRFWLLTYPGEKPAGWFLAGQFA